MKRVIALLGGAVSLATKLVIPLGLVAIAVLLVEFLADRFFWQLVFSNESLLRPALRGDLGSFAVWRKVEALQTAYQMLVSDFSQASGMVVGALVVDDVPERSARRLSQWGPGGERQSTRSWAVLLRYLVPFGVATGLYTIAETEITSRSVTGSVLGITAAGLAIVGWVIFPVTLLLATPTLRCVRQATEIGGWRTDCAILDLKREGFLAATCIVVLINVASLASLLLARVPLPALAGTALSFLPQFILILVLYPFVSLVYLDVCNHYGSDDATSIAQVSRSEAGGSGRLGLDQAGG